MANAGGLQDMVAGKSRVSTIDGKRGVLTYCGISIHELADNSTFEETAYLLLYGILPTRNQLDDFTKKIRAEVSMPVEVAELFKKLPKDAHPMSLLRTGVSLLGVYNPDERAPITTDKGAQGEAMMGQLDPGNPESPGFNNDNPQVKKAIKLIGRLVCISAAVQRLMKGQEFVEPTPGKSIAFNFLRCLNGKDPDEETEKGFDKCLILHADHEFNASTFTTRVIAATLGDIHSAIVGGIGALKGPLHGGANTEVAKMLLKVKDPAVAREWVKNALENKVKIMGFGHRMYKTEDPRATHLRKMSEILCAKTGRPEMYELSKNIEAAMMEIKNIYPNVDFYSASVYYCMGIDPEMYTPIFALSRTVGWLAHILEQQANNRLIRPVAEWVGGENVSYTAIETRG